MPRAVFHIASICLLAASFLPMAIPGFLAMEKVFARWEMKEKLEEEQLQTIRVKSSDIHWTFLRKECRIDGKMFDVEDMREDGEFLVLTGLYDEKETEIEKNISRNSEKEESKTISVILAMAQVASDQCDKPAIPIYTVSPSKAWMEAGPARLPSSTEFIITPPPKF